jgi:uncharacterized RDD family membrane protein YckC
MRYNAAVMNRAGFYIRLVAMTIDAVLLISLVYGVEYFLWEPIYFAAADAGYEGWAAHALWLVESAAVLLYTAFDVFVAGTPGKLLFRLRIASFDGTRAPFSRLLLRWLTKYQALIYYTCMVAFQVPTLELAVGVTFWIVGIGCVWSMRESRLTWHDEWAWTSVVWGDVPSSESSIPLPVPPSMGAA